MLVPSVDKNVNYLILEKLNDRDLGRVCQTNQVMRDLCKNDMFWKKRFVTRFGEAIPDFEEMFIQRQKDFIDSVKQNKTNKFKSLFKNLFKKKDNRNKNNKGKQIPEQYTWRHYYIDIVNWLENYYNENGNDDDLVYNKDINQIYDYMDEKTLKYLRCFLSDDDGIQRCGEFKDIDLLDPGRIIFEDDELEYLQDENVRRRYLELFSHMMDDVHRVIFRGIQIENILHMLGEDGARILLEKRPDDMSVKIIILDYFFEYDTLSPNFIVTYIPLDVLNQYIRQNFKSLGGEYKDKFYSLSNFAAKRYGQGKFLRDEYDELHDIIRKANE